MGGGGGSSPSRANKFLNAPAPPPPSLWALKPPSWALVHKTNYAPMIHTFLSAQCHFTGPKSQIPGPYLLPLALVMDMQASKILCMGLFNS